MKNIRNKIDIPLITILILFLCCITGLLKQAVGIIIIIVVHECGHIHACRKYEYPIKKVTFYPFGGMTEVEKDINTPLKIERKIAFAGVRNQCILGIIFFIFYKLSFLKENTYMMYQKYNIIIACFNLLPMIPLDGHILFTSILEEFMSYQRAYQVKCTVSVVCTFLFFGAQHIFSLNNYLIVTFLCYKTYQSWKTKQFHYEKFALERYLKTLSYQKIRSEEIWDERLLRKDTLHFFKKGEKYVHERELLAKKFDRSRHF